MAERLFHVAKEASVITFDLLGSLVIAFRAPLPSSLGADLAIQTNTTRPIQVKHFLCPTSPGFVPSVPALYSAEPNVPPLTNIRFAINPDMRPVLVVNIPDKQPAGTYAGAIVNSTTNEPGGYLSVTILP